MLICDNGSNELDKQKLIRIVKSNDNIDLFFRDQGKEPPSIAHGRAMDVLVGKVETEFFIVMDADCVLLLRSWDEILIKKMKTDKISCIGTPVVENKNKKRDFPNMFAVLFNNYIYKEMGSPSFEPNENWVKMVNKKNIESKDTGYMIRKGYIENNQRVELFRCKNTRNYKSHYYKRILCAEYYLQDECSLIACHFSRGSTKGYSKLLYNLPWYMKIPKAGNQVLSIKADIDIWRWIRISKKIIKRQINKKEKMEFP